MTVRFPFPSYPSGWYRVSSSKDLMPGKRRTVHYFGRDMVLFRAKSGGVSVFDAYCPHMGAHLGLGRVREDNLECAFHGWKFDATGSCVEVPGGRRIPPKAKLRTWPAREVNGQILVYHHPEGEPPSWEVPEFPESSDPQWTGFGRGQRWEIRTTPQELAENGVDMTHFSYLHHKQFRFNESLSVETDGPFFIHRTFQSFNVFQLARKLVGAEIAGPLDVHMYGLGVVCNRISVDAKVRLSYTYVFYLTPVEPEVLEMTGVISVKRSSGRLFTYFLGRKGMHEGNRTLKEDKRILDSKIHLPRPHLAEGDGPIMRFRRWAGQFYTGEESPGRRGTQDTATPVAGT
ncbi:Rieske 2Fe-2S domain-containing protein [Lentzea sp. NPDC058436]|uniref:Rieske 2Fe-2S domain-containing protein n=1 Tax=Lentzea sp. NPDC058436 TaxID=3346499 RepID=UPI0036555297